MRLALGNKYTILIEVRFFSDFLRFIISFAATALSMLLVTLSLTHRLSLIDPVHPQQKPWFTSAQQSTVSIALPLHKIEKTAWHPSGNS